MSQRLPILVGCEESQVITAALRAAGYEAYSCDLLPTRGRVGWHYEIDVLKVIVSRRWSMIILHPDCTAMGVCGNGTYGQGKARHDERIAALKWTLDLWELAKLYSDRVALENPGSVIFPPLKKRGANVQYVQPWMFGHTETKKTGFALHNLPPLVETKNVYEEMIVLPEKDKHKVWYMSPGKNRKRDRSETYSGIAEAITQQWAPLCLQQGAA